MRLGGIPAAALGIQSVVVSPAGALPAFPGAEGFGADSPGGRGGRIYEVTTLEDCLEPAVGCTVPVPGSLREALQASEPRIVVFRVSGTIEIDWQIPVRHPYLTVAGQSAPGGGIAIRNAPTNTLHAISIQTHDVVLRHLRFRPGRATPGTEVSDGLNLANGAHHVVIDLCSLSWSVDEGFDVGWSNPNGQSARDVTLQWSILSEGLVQEKTLWPPGFTIGRCSDALGTGSASPCFHSKAVLAGTSGTQAVATERVSLHHNFLAHNFDRNPLVSGSGRWDLVNNVVFDPNSLMGSAVASLNDYEQVRLEVNHTGNYTKRRVATLPHWSVELRLYKTATGPGFLVWEEDNRVRDSLTGPDVPGDVQCWDSAASAECPPTVFDSYRAVSPWPSSLTTPALTAEQARDTVPFAAGATRPSRDPVDTDDDGAGDTSDCAPSDPGAFALPSEVLGLRVDGDRQTLSWSSAAPGAGAGTVHDVVRGRTTEWPVGSGASETCSASRRRRPPTPRPPMRAVGSGTSSAGGTRAAPGRTAAARTGRNAWPRRAPESLCCARDRPTKDGCDPLVR